ncbi:hypothetical protein [Nocardia arizonensis]|uniref:hypothetical protein n=1 Tax=Nocardia arizonensis TaxID=1141647 RepID=UPI0012E7CAC7|nr:hypothetical protein [Nocardia arizonensis]
MLHPLLQFPFILTAETARRLIPGVDGVVDRIQRRRREAWYRNEMGEAAAELRPVENSSLTSRPDAR